MEDTLVQLHLLLQGDYSLNVPNNGSCDSIGSCEADKTQTI